MNSTKFNVNLFLGNIKKLDIFKKNKFDVVFTDALLIYIDPKNIHDVISEVIRISNFKIFFCELHTNNHTYYNDKWIHNYEKIIKKISQSCSLKIYDIPNNNRLGDWKKFGKIIEITKTKK